MSDLGRDGGERGHRASRRAAATLAVCVAAAGLWAAGSSGAPARLAACTPGPTTIGGAYARVWCGPARATVHVAGRTYHFTHGICQVTEGFTKGSKVLAINIGTQTLPPANPKASYFGLLTDKAKSGVYRDQAVGWQVPGKGFAALTNRVLVGKSLRKGSFSGKASVRINGKVRDVGVATGTWAC